MATQDAAEVIPMATQGLTHAGVVPVATQGTKTAESLTSPGKRALVPLVLYRRPLPATCIAFASQEGKGIFKEALETGHMDCYFRLASQFRTQDEPAYCGLSTLIMVLNALEIDPGRVWKGPWKWYHEDMLDCCVPVELVRKQGITFDEFICLADCNSLHTQAVRLDSSCSEDSFRTLVKDMTRQEDTFLVLSYSRKTLGQTGDGHFAPVSGYHPGRDLVLILDTARFKYPPHWISLPLLFQSMKALDQSTGLPRGYVQVRPAKHSKVLLLFKISEQYSVNASQERVGPYQAFLEAWMQLLASPWQPGKNRDAAAPVTLTLQLGGAPFKAAADAPLPGIAKATLQPAQGVSSTDIDSLPCSVAATLTGEVAQPMAANAPTLPREGAPLTAANDLLPDISATTLPGPATTSAADISNSSLGTETEGDGALGGSAIAPRRANNDTNMDDPLAELVTTTLQGLVEVGGQLGEGWCVLTTQEHVSCTAACTIQCVLQELLAELEATPLFRAVCRAVLSLPDPHLQALQNLFGVWPSVGAEVKAEERLAALRSHHVSSSCDMNQALCLCHFVTAFLLSWPHHLHLPPDKADFSSASSSGSDVPVVRGISSFHLGSPSPVGSAVFSKSQQPSDALSEGNESSTGLALPVVNTRDASVVVQSPSSLDDKAAPVASDSLRAVVATALGGGNSAPSSPLQFQAVSPAPGSLGAALHTVRHQEKERSRNRFLDDEISTLGHQLKMLIGFHFSPALYADESHQKCSTKCCKVPSAATKSRDGKESLASEPPVVSSSKPPCGCASKKKKNESDGFQDVVVLPEQK